MSAFTLEMAINSHTDTDATGSTLILAREGGAIIPHTIPPETVHAWTCAEDAYATARAIPGAFFLLIDGGNIHGDSWVLAHHLDTQGHAFFLETPLLDADS